MESHWQEWEQLIQEPQFDGDNKNIFLVRRTPRLKNKAFCGSLPKSNRRCHQMLFGALIFITVTMFAINTLVGGPAKLLAQNILSVSGYEELSLTRNEITPSEESGSIVFHNTSPLNTTPPNEPIQTVDVNYKIYSTPAITTDLMPSTTIISTISKPTAVESTVDASQHNFETIFNTKPQQYSPSPRTITELSTRKTINEETSLIFSEFAESTTELYLPLTHKERSKKQACKIPKLNSNDPSIKSAVMQQFKPINCRKTYSLIFDVETTEKSVLLQLTSPKKFGWKNCCYKTISRANINSEGVDNKERFSEKCYRIMENRTLIPPAHELIAVFCNSISNQTDEKVMLDAFAFVPLKSKVEKRVSKLKPSSSVSGNDDQVNIVILGLDAVSHMNFKRTLPQVRDYLVKNLSAAWMDGYVKVGDNTLPNLLAVLTNQTAEESKSNCSKAKWFDTCPFIWNSYRAQGYRTFFGEDATWMGTFNYLKNGFKIQPTDYYLRPISNVASAKIGSEKRLNAEICFGPRLSFQFLLNYLKGTATSMGEDRRYFQFIWSTALTHDFLNAARTGEPFLLEYFKWMSGQNGQDKNYLNKTVLILMSDHGIRWGEIRETRQGKLEESMPFVYFLFPPWFKKKYPNAVSNFILNRNRLTTPFDVYATLEDLKNLESISNAAIDKKSEIISNAEESNFPRGISLFLPIPSGRTCKTADIAEHWCVCHKSQEIPVNDNNVIEAANYFISALNSLVSKYPKCKQLALSSVNSAYKVVPENQSKFGRKGEEAYDLAINVKPGDGSFDATIVKGLDNVWKVSGDISRTNLYGNQSYCMKDSRLEKYCYCL